MPAVARYIDTENRFTRDDSAGGGEKVVRLRATLAQINAGLTVLPALPGFLYQLIDATLIAIGGAVSGSTAIVVLGTRAAAPVTLLSVAIAALTQSAMVRAGAANANVLADGASFTPLDVNTPITVGITGAPMATATAIDVVLKYQLLQA